MAQPPPDPPSQLFIENLLKEIYVWGPDAPPSAGPSHLHFTGPLSLTLREESKKRENLNISLKSSSLDEWF